MWTEWVGKASLMVGYFGEDLEDEEEPWEEWGEEKFWLRIG